MRRISITSYWRAIAGGNAWYGRWLSTTRLRGRTYLRAGILNTQSTRADVEALLDLLRALGLAVSG